METAEDLLGEKYSHLCSTLNQSQIELICVAMEEYGNERVNNSIELFGEFCKTLNEGAINPKPRCVECKRIMDDMEHNYGTPELLCCLYCYNEAQTKP